MENQSHYRPASVSRVNKFNLNFITVPNFISLVFNTGFSLWSGGDMNIDPHQARVWAYIGQLMVMCGITISVIYVLIWLLSFLKIEKRKILISSVVAVLMTFLILNSVITKIINIDFDYSIEQMTKYERMGESVMAYCQSGIVYSKEIYWGDRQHWLNDTREYLRTDPFLQKHKKDNWNRWWDISYGDSFDSRFDRKTIFCLGDDSMDCFNDHLYIVQRLNNLKWFLEQMKEERENESLF